MSFPFLSLLPFGASTVSCLSKVELFSDSLQQLILVRGIFSVEMYQLTDFFNLNLELPAVIEGAVVKRQAEYLAGRYLSRLAMQQSGLFYSDPPQLSIG
ncbi:MAG: hypothetical protein KA770_02820, partial [Shewanella sp.]|nr:hypothetical protein [Shewanella sp.]